MSDWATLIYLLDAPQPLTYEDWLALGNEPIPNGSAS